MESLGVAGKKNKEKSRNQRNGFFATDYEKCSFPSEFLETKVINMDHYAYAKAQFCIER